MRRFKQRFCACLLVSTAFTISAGAWAAEIIATKRSKVYHTRPDECSSAKKIGAENKVHFVSKEEAEESGRRLCKRCEALDLKEQESRKPPPPGEPEPDEPSDEGSRPRDPVRPPPSTEPSAALPEFVRVSEVLAGGTLVLDTGEKATVLGVICPERGQPAAREAVRFLTEQTQGRTIRVDHDGSPCLGDGRDALGRLMVYVTPEGDGRDLGGELIFQGYAWLDRDVRFDRQAEYARHEAEAWRAGRGIWARAENVNAGGEEVVIGRHAWNYHRPKCPHVAHLSNPLTMSLDEAKGRRLTPCSDYRGK